MKLDGIIDNVYFKQSIRSNTDNVSENDMKNFKQLRSISWIILN